jgi:hypothetical protein
MFDQLKKLQIDLIGYREAVDHIFSSAPNPKSWQECFFEILLRTSQLYVDYLLVMKTLPALEAVSSKGGSNGQGRANILREENLRENLQRELESSPCWTHHFKPQNPFSELTGLRSRRDYIDRITLHLPEVYEETFRVEECTKEFLETHNGTALAHLVIGLQHLGRNHISFVLQALEWAANEDSWEESSVVQKDS